MEGAQNNQSKLHLEEVWKQRSASDVLSNLELFFHHFKLALVFLIKSPLTSVLSILSVSTVLFILGLLYSVQKASVSGLNAVSGQLSMSVFLKDNASQNDWTNLEQKVTSFSGVINKQKLDKSAALKQLKVIFPDAPELLAGLEEDNPLPASLELVFDSTQGENLPEYAKQIKELSAVESVAFDGEIAALMAKIGSSLKGTGRFTSVVLLFLTLFLIATTIRISLYHESDEIEIMNLVGANPHFVQAPFVIGGALQGFFGALFASIILWIVENQVFQSFRSEKVLNDLGLKISVLQFQNCILLILIGVVAGIVGSFLASRRHR